MKFIWRAYGALICALAFTACGGLCHAQSQSIDIRTKAERLKGDALLENFKGVTHDGAYNFTPDGEPTLHYRETTRADGRTIYEEGKRSFEGVWIIRRGELCFVYEGAAMPGGCFRVYKVGNCFYYYSENLPQIKTELAEDYWTARSVKKGEMPSCEPAVS